MTPDDKPCSPSLYRITEAADILGVSDRHVRPLIARGELPACRFGRCIRVSSDDLANYIHLSRGQFPDDRIGRCGRLCQW